MVLQLSTAGVEDVDRIASVQLATLEANTLIHTQFPTPGSLKSLHAFLSEEMLDIIQTGQDSGKVVMVVRDTEADNQIISFAKWVLPTFSKAAHPAEPSWPKDCREDLLNKYREKADAVKSRVVGDQPCYRLAFMGTLPGFQEQGAGTLLTQWGLSNAKKANVPVYLRSTILASSLYRRLGFVALDGLSMTLPGNSYSEGLNVHEELGMLKVWDKESNEIDYWDSSLAIESLSQDYEAGIKPQQVVHAIFERIAAYKSIQPSVWLYIHPIAEVMHAANMLYTRWPDPQTRPPLWGVPFSVKDNFDVAGIPTTVGCPALAFTPTTSASVYQHCVDAGGLFIGKTNMEQLATGMTGCRSPFGTLHSAFSKAHIVGGSSSGSAVTVSEGLVSFSLGSDTAGSIRLPALFNGLVGFKPTKGTVSAKGVFPASVRQDCVSFLTSNISDGERVWKICKGFDKEDIFAKSPFISRTSLRSYQRLRLRFGTPPLDALKVCSPIYQKMFTKAVQVISENGGILVDLDWEPFKDAHELLYNSSFVLERHTIFPDGWFKKNKGLLHPVTRQVFEEALARNSTAVDVFKDLHKQASYKRAVEDILTLEEDPETGDATLTVLVVPTAPFHPTIEEVGDDPIGINGRLGAFAHFANVLDLVGVAMPCGSYGLDEVVDGRRAILPFGVTMLAGSGLDLELLMVAKMLEDALRDICDDD